MYSVFNSLKKKKKFKSIFYVLSLLMFAWYDLTGSRTSKLYMIVGNFVTIVIEIMAMTKERGK